MNWYKKAQTDDISDEELDEIVRPRWVPVDSSFIDEAAYSEEARILEVKIKGQVYMHDNVPKSVWDAFMASDSKGTFYNQVIKKRYGAKKKKD